MPITHCDDCSESVRLARRIAPNIVDSAASAGSLLLAHVVAHRGGLS